MLQRNITGPLNKFATESFAFLGQCDRPNQQSACAGTRRGGAGGEGGGW